MKRLREIITPLLIIFLLPLQSFGEEQCGTSRVSNPSFPSCGASDLREVSESPVECRIDPYGPPLLTQRDNCSLELCKEYRCGIEKCPIPGKPKCTSDNQTTRRCQLDKEEESCRVRWDGDPIEGIQHGVLTAKVSCGCKCKPVIKNTEGEEGIELAY